MAPVRNGEIHDKAVAPERKGTPAQDSLAEATRTVAKRHTPTTTKGRRKAREASGSPSNKERIREGRQSPRTTGYSPSTRGRRSTTSGTSEELS